jgi:23S rRNA (cytosine1962-C5)-methyltransferase
MLIADDWQDYELIDSGDGEKLERWGKYILRRPDPVAIWPPLEPSSWKKAHAHYLRSSSGGGRWKFLRKLPERWIIRFNELSFYAQPTGFKHTGIFPEQAVNWTWIMEKIRQSKKSVKLLNLFAYTGCTTIAAAFAGAHVCHVDAAKGMVNRAKENASLSGMSKAPIRYIVDDVIKFVNREKRRKRKYDAIIMDPPTFGRGPKGETWNIEKELYNLIQTCVEILSSNPLFFLVNSYTTHLSISAIKNILILALANEVGGKIFADELGLQAQSGLILPCGSCGRWES